MNSLHENILVVEDDAQIRNFICFTLEAEAYVCRTAATAEEAMRLLAAKPIDLMLLDLGLPDLDGTEVIRRLRTWSEMPIIVVSARDQDKEKVAVLDLGADDYLTKPFSASELLARIHVALRHMYKQSGTKANPIYQAGELRLDAEKRKVYLGETEIHVTPMEYSLLLLLFKKSGQGAYHIGHPPENLGRGLWTGHAGAADADRQSAQENRKKSCQAAYILT